jgi:hypothetical protein
MFISVDDRLVVMLGRILGADLGASDRQLAIYKLVQYLYLS